MANEAVKYVWEGAIPLQIHLHKSDVASHPAPPPALIHFRGYPSNILIPCEGEDSVKWNFVNSLKEAAYIINGNCKNVMNMSQSDQEDLWTSVMNGDLDAYTRLSPKLKMGTVEDEFSRKTSLSSPQPLQGDGCGWTS